MFHYVVHHRVATLNSHIERERETQIQRACRSLSVAHSTAKIASVRSAVSSVRWPAYVRSRILSVHSDSPPSSHKVAQPHIPNSTHRRDRQSITQKRLRASFVRVSRSQKQRFRCVNVFECRCVCVSVLWLCFPVRSSSSTCAQFPSYEFCMVTLCQHRVSFVECCYCVECFFPGGGIVSAKMPSPCVASQCYAFTPQVT